VVEHQRARAQLQEHLAAELAEFELSGAVRTALPQRSAGITLRFAQRLVLPIDRARGCSA
jgi:hypothetical protein